MAKQQPQRKSRYLDYPETDIVRSGCKVGWRYYKTKAVADKCSKAAVHNGQLQASEGFDFGYCCPGTVRLIEGDGYGPEFKGLYEVCIP